MVQREFTTLGISANTDTSVRQRREPGQALVPIPPLKQTNILKSNKKVKFLKMDFTGADLTHAQFQKIPIIFGSCKFIQWTNTILSKFWSQCGAAYVMCKCTTGTIRTVCVDINYRQTYNEIPYHYYDILSDDHVANKLLYSLLIQKFFHFFSCPQYLIGLLTSWTTILLCSLISCHYNNEQS